MMIQKHGILQILSNRLGKGIWFKRLILTINLKIRCPALNPQSVAAICFSDISLGIEQYIKLKWSDFFHAPQCSAT